MHEPHRNYVPNRGDPAAPTNPRLLNAMYTVARNDNSDTRHELYTAILESNFVLPLPEVPEGSAGGFLSLDEAAPLNLILLQDMNGRIILPAFTDPTALYAWDPDVVAYVALAAPTLLQAANDDQIQAIVVNVAGPTGGEISAQEIAILAQGAVPQPDNSYAFPDSTELHVRYPETIPPDRLLGQLFSALEAQTAISHAYLVDVLFPDGATHLLVGVGFTALPDDDTLSAIMQELVSTIQAAVPNSLQLDFIVLQSEEADQLSRTIRDVGLRIYDRS